MKVYLVWIIHDKETTYEDFYVYKVFDSKDKAIRYICSWCSIDHKDSELVKSIDKEELLIKLDDGTVTTDCSVDMYGATVYCIEEREVE